MQLTNNFTEEEFECQCGCGFKKISYTLVEELQNIRDTVDLPIYITSGCRCEQRNADVGGEDHSKHLTGEAADFYVDGMDSLALYQLLETMYPNSHGIGYYGNRVHFDVRKDKARWSA